MTDNAAAWSHAAVNILQDFLIVLLPMPEIRRLNLDTRKKISLAIVFGLGGFVCIIAIVRLYSLRTFGFTNDPTWDNVPTTIWSATEISVSFVCASLPAIRAALVRLFPRIFKAEFPTVERKRSKGAGATRLPDWKPKSPPPNLPDDEEGKPEVVHSHESRRSIRIDIGGGEPKLWDPLRDEGGVITTISAGLSAEKGGFGVKKNVTSMKKKMTEVDINKPLPPIGNPPVSSYNAIYSLSQKMESSPSNRSNKSSDGGSANWLDK